MGTFTIANFASVNIGGGGRSSTGDDTSTGWWATLIGSTDPDLIAGVLGTFIELWISPGTLGAPEISFHLDAATPCIVLDGVDFVAIQDLPPGWIADTLNVSMSISAGGGSGPSSTGRAVIGDGDSGFVHNGNLSANLAAGGGLSPNDMLNLILTLTCGGTPTGTPPPVGQLYMTFGSIGTSGTYTSTTQTWTLETPTDPIEEDTPVTVTSDGPDAMDFTQLLTVTLDWTDADGNPHSVDVPQILWIVITINLFTFLVPAGVDGQIVTVNVTSTQFSGSVELGKLITIFFLNATGIYTITAGKTNDTIYDNDNGGTIDVKIPNPFFKTGFIGG